MRRLVLAAIAALCCLAAGAQTHYRPHVWLGARAGMSMARVDFAPSVRQGWLAASQGALTFRYSEEKLFGLVAEFGWSTRGWKENFEEAPLDYSRSLTYLTLPVMTQISFGSPRVKCFVNIGPQFSYMISSSTSANFDYTDLSTVTQWPERTRETRQLNMDIENRFDYGITGGVGVEFYVAPRHSLTLEGRYYFGLGNIFHSTKADVFSASRCTSIEISLGYNFRLK